MNQNGWSFVEWSHDDWARIDAATFSKYFQGATIIEESCDMSVSTPSQELCDDTLLKWALEGQEKENHKYLSWDEIEEIVNSWDEESDKAQLKDLETSSSISEEPNIIGKDTIDDYPLGKLNTPKEDLNQLPKEDKFLQEARDTVQELELLLGYKADEIIEKVSSCNHLLIHECINPPSESLDTVDYSLVQSTNLEIDFIFPPYAFIPQAYYKNHLRKYLESVNTNFVNTNFINTNFNKYLVLLVWTIVFLLAQMVYCENRRRTKGPLAQPFDSCD